MTKRVYLATWQRMKNLLLVYIALGVLLGVGAILKPNLISVGSLCSILRWSSILGLTAVGQTIVMISGGIDVSVGAVVFLVSVLGSLYMKGANALIAPAILVCLGIGALCGLINGIGVSLLRLPPIIVTLSASTIINGVVWLITGGVTRGGPAPAFMKFAQTTVVGYVPLSFIFWLLISIACIGIMRRTILGRLFHAIGSNPVAADLCGVNVRLITTISYTISGICAAAAGLLLLGYLGMATLRFSDIYTLGSIAAAAIGGTQFFTGLGTIAGTIAGTLIIRVLFNILLMFQIPEAGRMIANGLALFAVVSIYSLQRGRT